MEYEYTTRNDFTSELFKIQIKNINSHTSTSQIRKFLSSLGINAKKIKVTQKICFVTFQDENERNKAIEKLTNQKFRNKVIDVKIAKPRVDPGVMAINSIEQPASLEDFQISLRSSIVPLVHLPYDNQLESKYKKFESILEGLIKNLDYSVKEKHKNLKLSEIVKSPQIDQYRNKCEFSFGNGYDDNQLKIGFKSGKYKNGALLVGLIEDLKPIPFDHIMIAKKLENLLRSEKLKFLSTFDHISHKGHLKQLMIRSNSGKQKYVRMCVDPQDLSEDEIKLFEEHLKVWLTEVSDLSIMQFDILYKRFSDENSIREVTIYGDGFELLEVCCGKTFKISPNSFFQVNLPAAQLLYEQIGREIEKLESDKPKVLLDICSGTGTIGQCLEKFVDKVVGIELVPEAVRDSEENAKINGLNKCSYMCGRAENLIDIAVDIHKKKYTIIAILDPPRCGLNNSLIKIIRKCESILNLYYISCDMKAAIPNFVALLQNETKRCSGQPFNMECVQPFDLFPHTDHLEVLLKFKR